ncbi:pro-adrenomedullin-like [Pristis pectinata]|uniref:pro-adrenomedullin-like n=1 Tax=Pristis pectinata TaxID=685728 RepID=UPI00223DC185|nr:pro-adrenomedullin-like [Pristis pectinata]
MVILALLAVFCLTIGTPGEAQMTDGIRLSEQGLPSSDVTTFLRQLANTKEDGMDQPEQSTPKSRTFSDNDHLFMKLDGSLDSSTAPHGRVKRHRHSLGQNNYLRHGSWGCTLTTCQTHNLANWLYQMAANKGKDGTAPKNTADPHSYGKKRRRRSIFLPGYSTRLAQ